MAKVWRREDAERGEKHKVFRNQVQEIPGLWRRLAGVWNARDHEYQPGASKLLHYTTLQTQPWRPFPTVLRYKENPNGEVWFAMERAADDAGFPPIPAAKPRPGSRNQPARYNPQTDEDLHHGQGGAEDTY